MGVVRCVRCDSYIDLDYNVEVFTKDQIPNLDCGSCDWICLECLNKLELEELEANDDSTH